MSDRELRRLRKNHLENGGATASTNQYLRALERHVGFDDLFPANGDLLEDANAAIFSTKFSDTDYQWLSRAAQEIRHESESRIICFRISVDTIADLRAQYEKHKSKTRIPQIITDLEHEAKAKGYNSLLIYAESNIH